MKSKTFSAENSAFTKLVVLNHSTFRQVVQWMIALFCIVSAQFGFAQNELFEIDDFGTNPGNLEFVAYLPKDSVTENRPLVIVLHGCEQRAYDVAQQTRYNKLADSLGFMLLYPQTNSNNNSSRCFNWFKADDISGRSGESASIIQMIEFCIDRYSVDTTQIFVVGLSAGGSMAVALMTQYPDIFSAGAIFAGSPYGAATKSKHAKKAMRGKVKYSSDEWGDLVRNEYPNFEGEYPSISVYHGLEDKKVHPSNANKLIAQWTDLHGARTTPTKVLPNFRNHQMVIYREFKNNSGKVVVRSYMLRDVGHPNSIETGDALNLGGKSGRYAVESGFHITWQSVVDFGLVD